MDIPGQIGDDFGHFLGTVMGKWSFPRHSRGQWAGGHGVTKCGCITKKGECHKTVS
jgi:hypothetical protein